MKDKKPAISQSWEKNILGRNTIMERTHINGDTYLNCWCPHCEKSLNDGDKAVFKIINNQGQEGISKVSPYLNILDRESTMHVDDDEELADVQCPHCLTSIIVKDRLCKIDDCKLLEMNVTVSDSTKLRLVVCIRRTCRWYEMSNDDNELLVLKDSHEW